MSETPSAVRLSGDASEEEILQALKGAGIADLDDLAREHIKHIQTEMRATGPVNDVVVVWHGSKYAFIMKE